MRPDVEIEWPVPLKSRQGGITLLGGVWIYYDFDWYDKLGHNRSVFPHCKSIAQKIENLTPPGSVPILLLTAEGVWSPYTVKLIAPNVVLHIVSVHAIMSLSADAANSLLGQHAAPVADLDSVLAQLDGQPEGVDRVIEGALNAGRVLRWATRDRETVRHLVDGVLALQGEELERILELAVGIVAQTTEASTEALGSWVDDSSELSLIGLAASGLSYAYQLAALEQFERLVSEDHPERVYQEFAERHDWMFGSRFVGRWPGRQLTLGNQQDLILQTADGYFDVIELKRPSDEVLRWEPSRKHFYPSRPLSQALGQVQNYLEHIDAQLHAIRARFDLDVHRTRAVIVMGRLPATDEGRREALRGLNSHLSRIEVWTYTQLLTMARSIVDHGRRAASR